MYAKVRVPGSCGELVQGLYGDTNCLISCPIDQYSVASATILTDTREIIGPLNKPKARHAVKLVLDSLDCPYGVHLKITSQLIPGKGLASSTADIAAAAWATGLALDIRLTAKQIAKIALTIEPSDGILYPGIVLFDHLYGTVQKPLGFPPPMKILTLDLGGTIDTIAFNQKQDLREKNMEKRDITEKAVQLVIEGIQEKSPFKIGQAATLSALANQKILPKKGIENLVEKVIKNEGYGITVAHSGTAVGLLLNVEDEGINKWQSLLKTKFSGKILFPDTKIVGGGVDILEKNSKGKRVMSK